MSRFHTLEIKHIEKTTSDCSVITFDLPESKRSLFTFQQGQFLTLKAGIQGQEVRRSYSLCSSPMEEDLSVAIKQIEDGVFSTYANTQLKVGDQLEVMEPDGNFNITIEPAKSRNHIAFAAGSGITPILSIIKTHLKSEPKSTFKLFYVNRTAKSIILKEEIEKLKNTYFERFQVFYFLTREHRDTPLLNGRLDAEKVKQITQHFLDIEDTAHCFICGPKEMIFEIRDTLQSAGLPSENIHFELFFSGETEASKTRIQKIRQKKQQGTDVTVIDGGKEFHFVMDKDYDNILDGALAAGADLPYACKGGVCSTCKCKIKEGTVEMKINYALEPDEVNQNFVLSCQAVPTTDKVVVDFDV